MSEPGGRPWARVCIRAAVLLLDVVSLALVLLIVYLLARVFGLA